MSVWFVIPSCRPVAQAQECANAWRDMGYKVAMLRQGDALDVDLSLHVDKYFGWAPSVNVLADLVLSRDQSVPWIVTGGDDTWPDLTKRADEISAECTEHFGGTFGVMQPTGDPWEDGLGRIIERIAGSPWLGAKWCLKAYLGCGPMWPYFHNWADEELQLVAQKLGVFWQRPDICHLHRHWGRGWQPKPAWWDEVVGKDYNAGRPLFLERKAKGFPLHEPIA